MGKCNCSSPCILVCSAYWLESRMLLRSWASTDVRRVTAHRGDGRAASHAGANDDIPACRRGERPEEPPSAPCARHQFGGQCPRVLRLRHLRHRLGPGVQAPLLPRTRPGGRARRHLRHLRGRLLRPPARRALLRLARRPARSQDRAGGDRRADGRLVLRHRAAAHLPHGRGVEPRPVDVPASAPGLRSRSGTGRGLDADGRVRPSRPDAATTRHCPSLASRSACCSPPPCSSRWPSSTRTCCSAGCGGCRSC